MDLPAIFISALVAIFTGVLVGLVMAKVNQRERERQERADRARKHRQRLAARVRYLEFKQGIEPRDDDEEDDS